MDEHWLVRPATIKRLWIVFGAVLAATVLAELVFPHQPHFTVERVFGFYALYGFAACVAMILAARALGALLKRPESYYEGGDD
jgi:hypothetical protein